MATGITKQERHSDEAQTAHVSGRDQYPLPAKGSEPVLSYDHRLPDYLARRWVPATFTALDINGCDAKLEPNALALCDNLVGLSAIAHSAHRARLIYLDPPYNTGYDFHSRALQHAYKDNRSTATYLEFMRRRLILARDCLADDGSIYVHIGHQMLGHLKVILDEIFGDRNFRNIISRRKCSSKNFTTNQYANVHDYLLFYTKSGDYVWNQPKQKASIEWIAKEYDKIDERGRYKLVPIHAPGTRRGETGLSWRGMNPPPGKHWQYAPTKLDQLDADGQIHWSRNGNPRRKVYLEDGKALPYTDNWDSFRDAHHQSIQVTGYPTEKNLDMLRMIVGASSEPGDLVIDPFCGSGTTLQAADDLGRRWIGFDESFVGIEAALTRLRHGTKPMGDYVQRTPKESLQGVLTHLLNDDEKARPNRRLADFRLFVDDELFAQFGDEIERLARI